MPKQILPLLIGILGSCLLCGSPRLALTEETPPSADVARQQADEFMKQAGQAYAAEQFAEAIARYRQAADLGNAWGQNNVAWMYATFRDAQFRDGAFAVAYALKATTQEPANAAFVRTLAAAYARVGEFDKAIAAQQRFIELLTDDQILTDAVKAELRDDHAEKLKRYQSHEAYVDDK